MCTLNQSLTEIKSVCFKQSIKIAAHLEIILNFLYKISARYFQYIFINPFCVFSIESWCNRAITPKFVNVLQSAFLLTNLLVYLPSVEVLNAFWFRKHCSACNQVLIYMQCVLGKVFFKSRYSKPYLMYILNVCKLRLAIKNAF